MLNGSLADVINVFDQSSYMLSDPEHRNRQLSSAEKYLLIKGHLYHQ